MRRMFLSFMNHIGFRRLMAGIALLFAAQLLLSSACLMASEAETDSHVMMLSVDLQQHCNGNSGIQQQIHTCFHCDEPYQASSSLILSLLSLDNADNFSIIDAENLIVLIPSTLTARSPTGFPRSSSLLFNTTQRILI